uniref:Uncharacterized protein n=1 Tax=Janibacter limosus TaxID=53458 RepID=A0AC61U476_9MICO|nr:hypothetical protein [Janibacter limosus]
MRTNLVITISQQSDKAKEDGDAAREKSLAEEALKLIEEGPEGCLDGRDDGNGGEAGRKQQEQKDKLEEQTGKGRDRGAQGPQGPEGQEEVAGRGDRGEEGPQAEGARGAQHDRAEGVREQAPRAGGRGEGQRRRRQAPVTPFARTTSRKCAGGAHDLREMRKRVRTTLGRCGLGRVSARRA